MDLNIGGHWLKKLGSCYRLPTQGSRGNQVCFALGDNNLAVRSSLQREILFAFHDYVLIEQEQSQSAFTHDGSNLLARSRSLFAVKNVV